ncbi:hypothetical protein V5O48_008777 [Marasmius crinis-equi]|uniref:Cytochrome P450 n=1 Tax=Marasmius crinis-equi TaxID=585013 RepID=A0ABR3FCY8_9AGAR
MLSIEIPIPLDSLILQATSIAVVGLLARKVYKRAHLYFATRHLAGPPFAGFIMGHFQVALDDDKAVVMNQWMETYGKVIRTSGMMGASEVLLTDLKAISHVLKHDSAIYQKPGDVTYLLERLTGHGVLVTEGDDHRKQRRVMNPAFGPVEIRAITEVFFEKSIELRDAWATQIENEGKGVEIQVDVLHWLSRMTLDVIGQAGFNYQLDAISGKYNALNEAFSHTFASGSFMSFTPETQGAFRRAHGTSSRIAKELYEHNRAAVEKTGTSQDRDLFSLLIKSNMSKDVPEAQKMTEEEVLAQVPTFLAAGHETTSTSTTFALYLISMNPEIQSKLRREVSSLPTDSPPMDQLNSLPYLDAVIRESLRVLTPVQSTVRKAMKDDIIPVEQPFLDRYGRQHHFVEYAQLRANFANEVKKGHDIVIPILAINKDKSLWGEDAEEFKPERWENLPDAVKSVPGVWGNLLTFLGGPHACIGWRFALVETKALVFTLVRAFEFELAVPKEDVMIKRGFVVLRPEVKGREGNQLPVNIRPVN